MDSRFTHVSDLEHACHRVESGHVALHVEMLDAASGNSTIVLLSEAEAPSSRWPAALLTGLAREFGRCVWFDTRDVGASTWVDEPYSLVDLVGDAYAVVNFLEVESVALLGRSMGGEIAMRLALAYPDAIDSLVLLSTTPGRRDALGMPDEWLIDKMSNRLFAGPPSDPKEQAQWMAEQMEWFSGPVFTFDRVAALAQMQREVAQGWRGVNGHGRAVMEADDVVDDLRNLQVPTTIIHGTADPVLPLDHARALHASIADSSLELIEGLGHELPDAFVAQLIELVAAARVAG